MCSRRSKEEWVGRRAFAAIAVALVVLVASLAGTNQVRASSASCQYAVPIIIPLAIKNVQQPGSWKGACSSGTWSVSPLSGSGTFYAQTAYGSITGRWTYYSFTDSGTFSWDGPGFLDTVTGDWNAYSFTDSGSFSWSGPGYLDSVTGDWNEYSSLGSGSFSWSGPGLYDSVFGDWSLTSYGGTYSLTGPGVYDSDSGYWTFGTTPTPTPAPTAVSGTSAPPNPWGYNFDGGTLIYYPPSNFCSYFSCISSFWNGVGYVVQCSDLMFSLSGGRSGVCSYHGGYYRTLYASSSTVPSPSPTPSPTTSCGVERWPVKTGTDPDAGAINLAATTTTTVSALDALPKPATLPVDNRISPTETTVFSIDALLTVYVREDDSDYHLVLTDSSGGTMIAEIPSPSCVGSTSPLLSGIANARSEFDGRYSVTTSFKTANIPVRVRGVGFFDFLHGQTGVAPNGIELHPVLDLQFNPAPRCDSAGTPTSTMYLPNITRTLGGPSGWDTPFDIQNVGSSAATVETSYYYFDSGALAACHKTTGLAPGVSVLEDPNGANDLTDNKQYSVVIRSFGAPVAASVNQVQAAAGRLEAASYNGFTSGARTVYVPNVTRRFYGYDIPLIIQNLGTATATVNARFVSFDGVRQLNVSRLIEPGKSQVIDPDSDDLMLGAPGLVDGTQYAVTVTATQPIAVVANAHNEAIGPLASSHVGLTGGALSIYGAYATKGTIFSNVVVQNVGSGSTTATLTFKPTNGSPAQSFTIPDIPAGQARAFDVRYDDGIALLGVALCGTNATATCLANGDYSLVVSASQPIAAVVLPNSDTTASAYVAETSPSTRVGIPLAARNAGGWSASLWVQSVSASAGTITFNRIGAAGSTTSTVALMPGTTSRIDLATVPGLIDGAQYAVTIVANGTITAVVREFDPAPGDGLMVREGFVE